jgi:ABC-2 type transport system permease protein
MINQVHSEWIKFRSVRSSIAMLSAAVLLGLGISAGTAMLAKADLDAERVLTGVSIANMIFLILGVQIIGQEYRFNTIRSTFSATPSRLRVVVAKAIVLFASVISVSIILAGTALLVAGLILNARGYSLDLGVAGSNRVIVGVLVGAVGATAFGFGVGAITRQPIAGIAFSLAWAAAFESTVNALAPAFGPWLPFSSATNMWFLKLNPKFLSPVAGSAYFLSISFALAAIGTMLMKRSDA